MALREKILDGIEGPPAAAVATIASGMPVVRFMVLAGFPEMTFVGATMKNNHKAGEQKKESSRSDLHLVGQGIYGSLGGDQG
jgi:pyridoxine/pyridoxamine 5'-phosphate oxidase